MGGLFGQEGKGREKWWGPIIFSLGPPKLKAMFGFSMT